MQAPCSSRVASQALTRMLPSPPLKYPRGGGGGGGGGGVLGGVKGLARGVCTLKQGEAEGGKERRTAKPVLSQVLLTGEKRR